MMMSLTTPELRPKVRNYASIKLQKKLNSSELCSARGCNLHREGVSKYCSKHYDANAMHGHPFGKRLRRKIHYGYEHLLAKNFIEANIAHVGIGQALDFINKWLSSDNNALTKPETQRLFSKGVSALDILIESTAVFLVYKFQPKLVPTAETLSLAIANATLHLASLEGFYTWSNGVRSKRYYRLSPKTRRAIGAYLTDNLRLLHINIASTIEGQLQAHEDYKMNYLKPFH